jgi:predicted amidophosphoribosyltransferase
MNCPKCGAQLLQGAGFCGACGYRLEGSNAPSVAAGQPAGFSRVVEFTLMKIHAVRVAATNMKFYINRRFHSP